jgi:hypothetical protein
MYDNATVNCRSERINDYLGDYFGGRIYNSSAVGALVKTNAVAYINKSRWGILWKSLTATPLRLLGSSEQVHFANRYSLRG